MNSIKKTLCISNKKLHNMNIIDLEYELNCYYCLLSMESFDNTYIMQKILFIQELILEKKNQ